MVKAVFFDRDGVLNHPIKRDNGFTAPWCVEEFKFMDHTKEAVQIVKDLGFKTFVVTNQPDVLNGYLSPNDLKLISTMVHRWLGIDVVWSSLVRNTLFYKPYNGMIEELIRIYDVDRSESFLIGDRWKDIVAGHRSNLQTIFIGPSYIGPSEYKHVKPHYIEVDVLGACKLIKRIT